MTNRELMTMLLKSEITIDDDGASYEAMIYYNVACPYHGGDKRALCNAENNITRELCVKCKAIWLDAEVDE
jgi:hypothetical protein